MADAPPVAFDTLIIACGNPMRGDDGIGPIVAEQVEASLPENLREQNRFIITHQLLPELSLELAQARCAVLIDARVSDTEPVGNVRVDTVLPEKYTASGMQSCNPGTDLTHHWTFPRLLAMAEMLFGHAPEAYTVSVTAEAFDDADSLSPVIEGAIPQMRDHVMRVLNGASPV